MFTFVVSCGDSFFDGTDLKDPAHAWPALIAYNLQKPYRCYAQGGVGNLHILKQIIEARTKYGKNAVYLINWTWIDRFDYIGVIDRDWHTVRPSLDDAEHDNLYYKHFHSEIDDKFRSLIYVSQAIELLAGHRYIMTYMDSLLLVTRWHTPLYIRALQNRVKDKLATFQGQTFLEWSRSNHYAESERWHPLESAHVAAKDYWLAKVKPIVIHGLDL